MVDSIYCSVYYHGKKEYMVVYNQVKKTEKLCHWDAHLFTNKQNNKILPEDSQQRIYINKINKRDVPSRKPLHSIHKPMYQTTILCTGKLFLHGLIVI